MTVLKHEMKYGLKSLIIWTVSITMLIVACMLMFPSMAGQMSDVNEMFSNMGGFSEAFGMDRMNFGTAMGFFGVECGNILGIGGAFFAALVGIGILAKEESAHTAEFLLTHGVSRARIITMKFVAITLQITILNVVCTLSSILSFAMISEKIDMKAFLLYMLALYVMQLEIAAICFAISAFLKRQNFGIGLGIALLFYGLNIVANINKDAEILYYFTPFHYVEAADILANATIDWPYFFLGLAVLVVAIVIGFVKYAKKDIA